MFKHIFPNTLGLIVTALALSVPAFVFTEASFSFLGIINYSDTTPCHWKFIDEALNVCNSSSVSEMLAPNHIVYDAVAAEVSTNTYTYTVNSDDLQQQVVYTVVLGGSIDEIRMKDVSFVLTNLYNSLDNVRDLFNDFMMDFNTKSNSLEDVCSNHFINEDVQGCSDFFSVRKNEVIKEHEPFLKILKKYYYNYNERFEFIKEIDGFDLDTEKEIEPIKIESTYATFRIDNVYFNVSLIDNNFRVTAQWDDSEKKPILANTLIAKKFKEI